MRGIGIRGPEGVEPLDAVAIRQRIADGRSVWTWIVGDDEDVPCVQAHDALELVGIRESSPGLFVVERDGAVRLEVRRHPGLEAIARVRQIWRKTRRLRLDRSPWRELTAAGAGRTVWRRFDHVHRTIERAGWFLDQMRPAPDPADVEMATERAYGMPTWRAMVASAATSGLWESEELLAERHLAPGDRLLDIGCGGGREAFGFARRGLSVVGVDACAALVDEAARVSPPDLDVSFRTMRASRLDFDPGTFDAVYLSSEIYAGIAGRATRVELLAACRRLVRPGGVIVLPVSVLPRKRWRLLAVEVPRAVWTAVRGHARAEAGDRWQRCGPDEDAPLSYQHRFQSEDDVRAEIEAAGLRVVDRISSFFVTRAPAEQRDEPRAVRYRRSADVAADPVDGGLLLVHLGLGTTFRLNGTGRSMWQLAESGASAGEIADRLHGDLGASRARVEADAEALLRELAASALLEPVMDTGP